ncbi:ribosome-associated translation inhibitor RaiA [Candidatus Kaiserbacteria bacterium]|nr:ribosome-associated translation inhibitor RaiA [Candidatus Kaiserbacteria bacterium]
MDIRIKTTDYELTSETRSYLDDRIASLEKFLGENANVARCEVELGRAAGGQRHGANMWFAEIRILSPGSAAVYARNNASSVNAAIDDVKEEIERQLRREKKLHIRVMRKTGSAIKNWMRFGQ